MDFPRVSQTEFNQEKTDTSDERLVLTTDVSDNTDAILLNTDKRSYLVSEEQKVTDNSAKRSYPTTEEDKVTTNSLKVTYDAQQAVSDNSAKLGYTDVLVSANSDVANNTQAVSDIQNSQNLTSLKALENDYNTKFSAKEDSLDFGITNGDVLKTTVSDAAQGEFLRYNATGVEGRTIEEVKSQMALSKSDVGLSSVNDTADSAKPVSTLQQAEIDLKADDSLVQLHAGYHTAHTAEFLTKQAKLNTSTLFHDSDNSRVGIGTSTPAKAFHLQGTDGDIARFERVSKQAFNIQYIAKDGGGTEQNYQLTHNGATVVQYFKGQELFTATTTSDFQVGQNLIVSGFVFFNGGEVEHNAGVIKYTNLPTNLGATEANGVYRDAQGFLRIKDA